MVGETIGMRNITTPSGADDFGYVLCTLKGNVACDRGRQGVALVQLDGEVVGHGPISRIYKSGQRSPSILYGTGT
jgi:hypothetical protein